MVKQILVADDDAGDAEEILLVLQNAGLTNPVAIVADGEEAVDYLKGEGQFADREKFPLPSILFLDLRMPRRTGLEVLEWLTLQPQLTNMLIVVLSGYDNPADVSRAYQLGAHTFLTKPIKPEDVDRLRKAFYRFWT
jgi:CheY-like chemotaxis protein